MVACCVPCCLSSKGENKDRSFHLFPTDPVKRKEWERSIFGEGFNMELRIAHVCSKHFKSTDFTRMNCYNQKRKILKREAVPSVFISNMKRKEPSKTGAPFKRLKFFNMETKVEELPEISSFTNEKKSGKVYSNAKSYGLKITHLKKMVNSRTKKIEQLEKTVSELNKKLDYYEKNAVFQNMKKIMMLEEQGEGNTRTSFILTQVKNYNKKKPLWPENVIRESVILHEISQEAYNALIKREILQLPTKMTLHRYVKSGLMNGENPKEGNTEPKTRKKRRKPNENNQKSLCYLVVDTATGNQHYIYGRPLPENDSEQNNDEEENAVVNQDEMCEEQDNNIVDDEEENEDAVDEFEEDIVNEDVVLKYNKDKSLNDNEDEIINENDYEILNKNDDELMDEDEDENFSECENVNKNEVDKNEYEDESEYEGEYVIDFTEENENDCDDKSLKEDHDGESRKDYEEIMNDCEENSKNNSDEENWDDYGEESVKGFEEESVKDYEEMNVNDTEEENGKDDENRTLNPKEDCGSEENQAAKLGDYIREENKVLTDPKKNMLRWKGHPLIVFARVAANNQQNHHNNEKPG